MTSFSIFPLWKLLNPEKKTLIDFNETYSDTYSSNKALLVWM